MTRLQAAGIGTIDETVWAARSGTGLGAASALEGFGREADAVRTGRRSKQLTYAPAYYVV